MYVPYRANASFNDDDILPCPQCGGWHLHQERVEVFTREHDDAPSQVIVVDDSKISIKLVNENPSSRREGLLIFFSCEECRFGHKGAALAIYQHKGNTYVNWVKVESSSPDTPK